MPSQSQPADSQPITLQTSAELIACRLNDWGIEYASSGAARLLFGEDRPLLDQSLRSLIGPEILEAWIEAAGWAGINRGLTRLFNQRASPQGERVDVALHRQDQLLVAEITARTSRRSAHDDVGYLHVCCTKLSVAESGAHLAKVLASELRLASGAARVAVLAESAGAGIELISVDSIRSLPALASPPPQQSLLTNGSALFNTPEPRVRLLRCGDAQPSSVDRTENATPLVAHRLQLRSISRCEHELLDWLGATSGFCLAMGGNTAGSAWVAVGQMPAAASPTTEQLALMESLALLSCLRLHGD